jgi:16S rRNA (guanine(527)-N(7))-methyltransferase RsmG
MAFTLPALPRGEFDEALDRLSPVPLAPAALEALWQHYEELRRWNQRLSLLGPGTRDEILLRHYGESLAALPLIPAGCRVVVDLGSGAGFPGFVLAAARPELEVTLVEARERKWAFLLAAARRASLPCRCLNARVAHPLPAGFPDRIDLLTIRALKLDAPVLGAVTERLAPGGTALLWVGLADPDPPAGFAPGRTVRLAGSERRRILELRRTDPR